MDRELPVDVTQTVEVMLESVELAGRLEDYIERTRNAKWWTIAQYVGETAVGTGAVIVSTNTPGVVTAVVAGGAALVTTGRGIQRSMIKRNLDQKITRAENAEQIQTILPQFEDPKSFGRSRQLLLLKKHENRLMQSDPMMSEHRLIENNRYNAFMSATQWMGRETDNILNWYE